MAEIQAINIAVLKEQEDMRGEDENTDKMTKSKEQVKAGRMNNYLECPGNQNAWRLKVQKPTTGRHKFADDQEGHEDVHKYITSMNWVLSDQNEKVAMALLEMMIHFEIGGRSTKHTEEGIET